jgi:hypothetical protein
MRALAMGSVAALQGIVPNSKAAKATLHHLWIGTENFFAIPATPKS